MIAYHILCHDNFAQVIRLIDSLYTREDTFLIDIDDGKNPDTRALNALSNRPNVHIVRDANIGWGGVGTLRKTIKGAFKLLELRKNWQYYVVLSGQDLPIKSNDYIKQHLATREKEKINYIQGTCPKRISVDSIPLMSNASDYTLLADRGHTRVYLKPGTIDIHHTMYVRLLLNVTEVGEKGEVFLETVEPLLQRAREDYFSRYPFHMGANWFNLHRSLLEHMANDPFTYELYDRIRGTFIPDESYFQTYIMNSPFRDTVCEDIGRHILRPLDKANNADVKVLEQTDWESINNSTALYGRKFDTRRDKQIVDRVLESRAGFTALAALAG